VPGVQLDHDQADDGGRQVVDEQVVEPLQEDPGWARYISHVSECPDCREGVDCRVAERLHTEWKAAKRTAREGRRS